VVGETKALRFQALEKESFWPLLHLFTISWSFDIKINNLFGQMYC